MEMGAEDRLARAIGFHDGWSGDIGGDMKGRRLIDAASFGPDALKAVGQAFDEAWKDIAGNFGNDAQTVEAARLNLAKALLSVANEESRDVPVLKRAALEAMAQGYKTG
jgi:hypothetical protein